MFPGSKHEQLHRLRRGNNEAERATALTSKLNGAIDIMRQDFPALTAVVDAELAAEKKQQELQDLAQHIAEGAALQPAQSPAEVMTEPTAKPGPITEGEVRALETASPEVFDHAVKQELLPLSPIDLARQAVDAAHNDSSAAAEQPATQKDFGLAG